MISEKTKTQLLAAVDRQTFIEIAEFNGLKTRESLKAPVLFAYEQGDYKSRISSSNFCLRCGTASSIVEATIVENVCYCEGCDNRRSITASDLSNSETAKRFGVLNDPFLLSDRDAPEHVVRGEQFDDKLSMYRNEY